MDYNNNLFCSESIKPLKYVKDIKKVLLNSDLLKLNKL